MKTVALILASLALLACTAESGVDFDKTLTHPNGLVVERPVGFDARRSAEGFRFDEGGKLRNPRQLEVQRQDAPPPPDLASRAPGRRRGALQGRGRRRRLRRQRIPPVGSQAGGRAVDRGQRQRAERGWRTDLRPGLGAAGAGQVAIEPLSAECRTLRGTSVDPGGAASCSGCGSAFSLSLRPSDFP